MIAMHRNVRAEYPQFNNALTVAEPPFMVGAPLRSTLLSPLTKEQPNGHRDLLREVQGEDRLKQRGVGDDEEWPAGDQGRVHGVRRR